MSRSRRIGTDGLEGINFVLQLDALIEPGDELKDFLHLIGRSGDDDLVEPLVGVMRAFCVAPG